MGVIRALKKALMKHFCPGLKALFLLGLLCLSHTISLKGQGAQVSIVADTQSILIGEPISLTLTVKGQSGAQVGFPNLTDALSGFELLEMQDLDSIQTGGVMLELKQGYTITSFDSGSYQLPPLAVAYGREGRVDTLYTNPLRFEVQTVEIDTTQSIKPIKDPLSIPITLKELLPISLGVLALMGIILGVLYFFVWRKKPETPKEKKLPPPVPAHEIAMRKLAQLEAKKLWQQGEVQAYYDELTDVIREYLEARYKVQALESTTDEIIREVEQSASGVTEKLRRELKDLLQRADLVKFAKHTPDASFNLEGMDKARAFIRDTRVRITEMAEQTETETSTPTNSDKTPA